MNQPNENNPYKS